MDAAAPIAPRAAAVRRRAATPALVLAAGLLLSACGADRPGAAAVVGGQAVPVSQLQTTTDALMQEGAGRGGLSEGDAQRTTLSRYIYSRVVNELGRREGVSVTQGEVDARRAEFERSVGGAEQLRQALASPQYLVAPGDIDSFVHDIVLREKLAAKLAPGKTQAEQNRAVSERLIATAREMGVDVNPRYGRYDYATGAVQGLVSGGLAKPEATPSASPSGR